MLSQLLPSREEPVEEGREVLEHVDIWNRVECRDPADEELARKGVGHVDALAQERHEAVYVEVLRLGHHVLHQPVEQLHAVLHLRIRVRGELEETVEDVVEVADAQRACHLGDVVQCLAAVVANARVLRAELPERTLGLCVRAAWPPYGLVSMRAA